MQTTLYTKKGQLGGAVGAVITLIVGVGVSVLVLIFVGTLGGQTYNLVEPQIDDLYGTATDTIAGVNGTTYTLSHDVIESGTMTFKNATNASMSYGAGNYTINYNAGTVKLVNAAYAGSTNVSYTFGDETIQSSVKGGITSAFEALEQTGDYLPIIVLAVVIALVLALVLSFTSFGGGGMGRGSAL